MNQKRIIKTRTDIRIERNEEEWITWLYTSVWRTRSSPLCLPIFFSLSCRVPCIPKSAYRPISFYASRIHIFINFLSLTAYSSTILTSPFQFLTSPPHPPHISLPVTFPSLKLYIYPSILEGPSPVLLRLLRDRWKCVNSRYKRNSFPLWQHSVHHRHHAPPLVPVLNKLNSVHATTRYFLSIHLVIVFFLVNSICH